jgi:hypothetical protein
MDTPETLAADMLVASGEALVGSRVIVRASAEVIKADWKASVYKTAPIHNAHAAEAITYNTRSVLGGAEAEIGYDKDRNGGALGNLLEYGGGGDHSPPHRDGGRALDAEEPRFTEALAALVEKLL